MDQIQIFQNKEFGGIRTVKINDIIYFAATDVANALEVKKPQNAIAAHIDEADFLKWGISSGGKKEW